MSRGGGYKGCSRWLCSSRRTSKRNMNLEGEKVRFQRVLFVIPNLRWFYGYPPCPHPGVGYLVELLEQNGIKCDVLDMTLGYEFSGLRKRIEQFNPDLIGITLYSYRYRYAYQLISQMKQITDKPVVIGGPHVSLFREKTLEDSPADFAIKHEGEYPLLELCFGKVFEEIDNLIYREARNIKDNPSGPFERRLDDLPFPRYTPFEMRKYSRRSIGIVSSRGCPQQCSYCSVKTTMGRGFRPRSPQNVVSELKYWNERGYRHFEFHDDTFNQNVGRVYGICDGIEKGKLTGISISCPGMRLDRVDQPLLKRMKEVGFHTLQFGIESFNDQILQSMKKGETTEQMEEGVRIACELGYDVVLFFMIGFPGETMVDVQRSFDFSLKYPIVAANFYNVIPYPGTELFDYLEKNNLFSIDPEVYLNEDMTRSRRPLFRTISMTMAERKKALELGERFSRKTRQKNIEQRLRRFGILGEAFTWFITTKLIFGIKIWLDHYRLTYKLRLYVMKNLKLRKAYQKD